MSASDPQGGQQFWFNGVPFPGLKTGNDTGTVKFWFNGVPAGYVFPATGNVSISPAAATLQLTTTTPVLNAPINLTPTVASLTLTGLAPVIALRTVIQPAAGLLSLATNAPVLSTYTVLTPAVATLALTTTTPTLSINTGRTPTVATLILTTTTPVISSPPASASLTLARNSPIVTIEETLFPASDIATGTWTNESGGLPLWPSIDENSPNDADYIQSAAAPVNDLCKIGLSAPPDTLTTPFNIFYRIKKDITGTQINLTVALLQGTTQIASWTHADISTTPITVQQTLTAPQLASISDFTNLSVTFNASTYTGPGDVVSGAVGAWALRAWSRSTIGSPAIRLIASSDTGLTGNSSDFATIADGSLDVASIATFQAANPGTTLFVIKFYDQTLSGQDLTCFAQVDHYIPKFQLAGFGSRPVVFQDNLNMNLTSGGPSFSTPTLTFGTPYTMVVVFNYNEVFSGVQPFQLEATGPNFTQMGFQLNQGGTNLNKINMSTALGASFDISSEMDCSDFNWHSVIGVFDAASSVGYIDGVGTAQAAMVSRSQDPNGFAGLFGSPFGGNALSGSGVEGGLWNRALSPTEIADITANQRSYWGF